MAIPPTALRCDGSLDPHGEKDFLIDLSAQLETGEAISSFSLTPQSVTVDSIAYAVTIMTGAGYTAATQDSDTKIKFWAEIATALENATVFDGRGLLLPVLCRWESDNAQARKDDITCLVHVVNK